MNNSLIHHLGIGLVDPAQAIEPFDRLLSGYLGMERLQTQEAVAGWKGRGSRICLYPVKGGSLPGALQHIAFTARSQGEVEAFPPWAVRSGFAVTISPRLFSEYGADYFATFFNGPENLRLELVHFPDGAGAPSARVLRWKATWESRDPDRVAAMYANGATHMSGLVPQLYPEANGTVLHGVEQIREYARRGLSRFSELRFELQTVTETEDRGIVEYLRHSNIDAQPRHVVESIEWDGARISAVRVFHA